MNVAILGASAKPERMVYLAQQRLIANGHKVFPVSPVYDEILGKKTYASLSDIKESVDTLTVYVSPDKFLPLINEVIQLKPKRIILNPGTENHEVTKRLDATGIAYLEACTLVMLSAGNF